MSQSPHDPAPEPSEAPAPPPAAPTPRIRAAAAVAGLEGLAVAAWGVTMFFTDSDNAVLAGLTVLLMAALPLAAAYGLGKVRRWSRGPALIMQLLALPIAWTMLHSSGAVVPGGVLLGALAVAGLVCLVHPSTTDALGIRRTTT
ncbi:hypothetical protein OG900_13825 [Streptomyces sp. NBC_00433]